MRYEGIFTPPSEQGTLSSRVTWECLNGAGFPLIQIVSGNCQPNGTAVCFETDPTRSGNPMEQPKDAKGTGTESGISRSMAYRMASRSIHSFHRLVAV